MPVIVNVSQGMNAGAHDGTSLLESAFDEFSGNGREPGFIIVKSAGNERGFKGHAELTLLNGQTEFLKWNSAHPHIGPDVVELWFKACDKFNFVLRNPAGKPSKLVSCTYNEETGSFPSGNGFQMSYVRYHQDNGDSRLLVTIWPKFKASIESGTWTLEVQGASVIDGELHAWIERDDSRSINFTDHISDKTTLSIPGTAGTVISVGAVAASKPFSLANYSSYGPTRDSREKPDLAAPGEQIIAARGGTVDGIKTMSGTSMAAPHVTGAIALLFSYLVNQGRSVPNAAQVRAAISQMTQNYNGRHNPGMGFGVLDVENLINAFL
jgi:endonuclease G